MVKNPYLDAPNLPVQMSLSYAEFMAKLADAWEKGKQVGLNEGYNNGDETASSHMRELFEEIIEASTGGN